MPPFSVRIKRPFLSFSPYCSMRSWYCSSITSKSYLIYFFINNILYWVFILNFFVLISSITSKIFVICFLFIFIFHLSFSVRVTCAFFEVKVVGVTLHMASEAKYPVLPTTAIKCELFLLEFPEIFKWDGKLPLTTPHIIDA